MNRWYMRADRVAAFVTMALVLLPGCRRSYDHADGGPRDAGLRQDVPRPTSVRCGPRDGECDVMIAGYCGPGRACRLVMASDGYTTVCTDEGTITEGGSCLRSPECAAGLHCDGDNRFCRAFCCSDDDCDRAAGQFCQRYLNADGVGACRVGARCSVLTQEGCGITEGCYRLNARGEVGCQINPGTAPAGAACAGERLDFCAPGHDCVAGVCRAYCDRTLAVDPCPSGSRCERYFDDIGVCLPAP
jgi:hypothetical protein